MSKYISVIVPYIIAGIVLLVHFIDVSYKEIILAGVLGILIGFWFLHVTKTEGTKPILICLFVTLILLIVGDVVAILYYNDILPELLLCSILQVYALYMIKKNKPRLTMSYKYSFRNKRKRYF